MKNYIKILVGVTAVAVIVFLWLFFSARSVEGITDRDNYQFGDLLKISIKNNLGQAVCFSSCYPYLAEIKVADNDWKQYDYAVCPVAQVAVDCVPAGAVKKFQLSLGDVDPGINRLKLQVCVNCAAGQPFRVDSVLYSNMFEVK